MVANTGFKIAGRAADDLEHLRGGRLLLQRFGKIGCSFGEVVCSLTQFIEYSRVLDGDHSLGRRSSQEVRSSPRERSSFFAVNYNSADQVAFFSA